MSSENDTNQQLLEKMSELNSKLDVATAVVANLTKKVDKMTTTKQVSSPTKSLQPLAHNLPSCLGYVNWKHIHTQQGLDKQRLVKVSDIRAAVAMLKGDYNSGSATSTFNQGKNALSSMSGYTPTPNDNNYNNNYYGNVNQANKTSSTTTVNVRTVDKETRFPVDAVYVDTNIPHVKAEIEFLRQVNVKPTDGMIERFIDIIEKGMHTTRSFEEKYDLRWE